MNCRKSKHNSNKMKYSQFLFLPINNNSNNISLITTINNCHHTILSNSHTHKDHFRNINSRYLKIIGILNTSHSCLNNNRGYFQNLLYNHNRLPHGSINSSCSNSRQIKNQNKDKINNSNWLNSIQMKMFDKYLSNNSRILQNQYH